VAKEKRQYSSLNVMPVMPPLFVAIRETEIGPL